MGALVALSWTSDYNKPGGKVLELLVVLGVGVFVALKFQTRRFEQAKAQWLQRGAKPRTPTVAAPAPQPRPRLAIEGTQRPRIANMKFVRNFGLNPRTLADLRVYAHFGRFEQFPDAMRALLPNLHASGCALGSTLMELLFHGRALQEGEAIYFALVAGGREPRVVAFVDRLRLQ
jgi:hypothetical protein